MTIHIAQILYNYKDVLYYGYAPNMHDFYLFEGCVISSVLFLDGDNKCTILFGKDSTCYKQEIIFQILYNKTGKNYIGILPPDIMLEDITEYGINFDSTNRIIYMHTCRKQSYYADLYNYDINGNVVFKKIKS